MGKLIGGAIGWMVLGFIGAMIGIFIGHQFDQARQRFGSFGGFGSSHNRAALDAVFFETTFKVLGHLAKADGRVSEVEVAHTEALMDRMGLRSEQRRRAISLFKQGAGADFELHDQLMQMLNAVGRDPSRLRLFLEQLISIALADGELHDNEREVLAQIAHVFGIPRGQFARLLDMLSAQAGFSEGGFGHAGESSSSRLENAYRALGVEASASDAEVKKAYRKLLSEHHPDKLMSKGLPDDVIRMATEKTQELHAAWDVIKKARG